MQLSISGSDLEHRVNLRLSQLEDLEPLTVAEPKGEKGWVHVSVWGGVSAGPHREESLEAGVGPGAKTGIRPPIWWTAVREDILLWVPGLGLLRKALGRFLSLERLVKRQACG